MRKPRSVLMIMAAKKEAGLSDCESRVETLDAIEVDEAIRFNNEYLASVDLDSKTFWVHAAKQHIKIEWKLGNYPKVALCCIKYLSVAYRLARSRFRIWLFPSDSDEPYSS